MFADSELSPFITSDGQHLAVVDWMPAHGTAVRGVVLLIHGLGEHIGRYADLAKMLNSKGFAVRGYDQHGHGESAGVQGCLPSDNRLLEDLTEIVDHTRTRMAPDLPLILFGHSLGGLVAARFVSLDIRPIQALVLSSPALDAGLNPWQKMVLLLLPRWLPDLRVGNGLDPAYLSHNPKVVADYLADHLVHDRISLRLGRFIADAGAATLAAAPNWRVPTLLLFAGADHLVNPHGSRRFAQAAPLGCLTSVCFESMFHELFNENDNRPVLSALKCWLDQRF